MGAATSTGAARRRSAWNFAHSGRVAGSPPHAFSTSRVTVAELNADTIERYIASGEPFGKAGAYAIQGAAGAWVSRIDGSYTGIMGLPLFETAGLLRAVGMRW